jgi:hypothetical protein
MHTGYHLRFLEVDEAERSIDEADIVRVPPFETGAYTFGVQLHVHPTPPTVSPGDEIVVRLQRDLDESEGDFVQRAFREAAARQQHATLGPHARVAKRRVQIADRPQPT